MSFLNEIKAKCKFFEYGEVSDYESIEHLKIFSPVAIPEEYFDIITENKEIEFHIKEEKYISIWGAKRCVEMNKAYHIQKYILEGIAIADDGFNNVLLYANGKKGFGVYIANFGDLNVEEMKYISKSMKELVIEEIGINVFMMA